MADGIHSQARDKIIALYYPVAQGNNIHRKFTEDCPTTPPPGPGTTYPVIPPLEGPKIDSIP